MQEDI